MSLCDVPTAFYQKPFPLKTESTWPVLGFQMLNTVIPLS